MSFTWSCKTHSSQAASSVNNVPEARELYSRPTPSLCSGKNSFKSLLVVHRGNPTVQEWVKQPAPSPGLTMESCCHSRMGGAILLPQQDWEQSVATAGLTAGRVSGEKNTPSAILQEQHR